MILLIVVGVLFYQLAKKFDKNPWLWSLGMIALYIGSQLAIGFVFGILLGITNPGNAEQLIAENELMINVVTWILGIALTAGIYYYIKAKWIKQEKTQNLERTNKIHEIGSDSNN